jgi:hypothetical protein
MASSNDWRALVEVIDHGLGHAAHGQLGQQGRGNVGHALAAQRQVGVLHVVEALGAEALELGRLFAQQQAGPVGDLLDAAFEEGFFGNFELRGFGLHLLHFEVGGHGFEGGKARLEELGASLV